MANTVQSMKPTKYTVDNVTLSKIAKHFIELQQVTSSGDTLQFNHDWARASDVFYVNTGSTKLPLNKGIANGKDYGQGINPATGSASAGYDKVYAEIDAFKIDDNGNYVIDVFPADKLCLENADRVANVAQRRQLLKKITLHQLPVAYLTDHFVAEKNPDGSVKKDGNGNPVYQVSKVTPYTVVYRAKANYHDPYNSTPDWYRKVVQGSGSSVTTKSGVKLSDRSIALAMIESLVYYLRGIDFVSYDYYTPDTMEILANTVDESALKIVPSTAGLDGIKLDNAKLETLLPNGIMSKEDTQFAGEPTNNNETGEDPQVVPSQDGPVFINNVEQKKQQVEADLGMTGQSSTTGGATGAGQTTHPSTRPASHPSVGTSRPVSKSSTKSTPKKSTTSSSKSSTKNKSSK